MTNTTPTPHPSEVEKAAPLLDESAARQKFVDLCAMQGVRATGDEKSAFIEGYRAALQAQTAALAVRDAALIAAIQSAIESPELLDGLNANVKQMEFVKAGARRVIFAVNRALKSTNGGDAK